MLRAILILGFALTLLEACKTVPPEVTVGRSGDGHGSFLNPDSQGDPGEGVGLADDDDLDDLDDDAGDAPPGPMVQNAGVTASGCKIASIGGVPVVARCRRLADHHAVEPPPVKKGGKSSGSKGRPNAPRGDERYGEEPYDGDESQLSGWAAHTGPESSGSTFDNVSGLFSEKQSYWMYHRRIAPGSLVEVRANRRKVRLNVYRGDPPGGYHGRVAVLNYPAAARLDMLRRGRARVTMRVIRDGPP